MRSAADVDQHRPLADRLPPGLRLGTSSWTFPGWTGHVWAGRYPEAELARDGLAAYARHPLLRTVGLDRTHYAPLGADALGVFAGQVPADFRFLVKAHEWCTLARFPVHARYGARRGTVNNAFLDAAYCADRVVAPAVAGLGARLGPLLFQFAPQSMAELGGRWFPDRLYDFFSALPGGVHYAIEIRTPGVYTPEYAEALYATGVTPCLLSWPGMPTLATQAALTGADRFRHRVIRWMLNRNLDYSTAKQRYQPYTGTVDPDEQTQADIAELAITERETWVIANNKAEGCAPESLTALAAWVAHRFAAR